MPLTLQRWDNPETIRVRKYLTGTHLVLQAQDRPPERTPREEVWSDRGARLWRYKSGERAAGRAVLLVYGFVLRPDLLDLAPGASLVEDLVRRGFDVYLLDPGLPRVDERDPPDVSLDEYVTERMPAAAAALLERAGTDSFSLVGHSMAGTLSLAYVALGADPAPSDLVLVSAPVDFRPRDAHMHGLWTLWHRARLDPHLVMPPAAAARPAARLASVASRIAPAVREVGSRLASAYGLTEADAAGWLAACRWVDDAVRFPRTAFRQWFSELTAGNLLARGEWALAGRPVELERVRLPVLNVMGRRDSAVPLPQATGTLAATRSRGGRDLVVDAGHVGLVAGPAGPDDLWPALAAWLESPGGGRRRRPSGGRAAKRAASATQPPEGGPQRKKARRGGPSGTIRGPG